MKLLKTLSYNDYPKIGFDELDDKLEFEKEIKDRVYKYFIVNMFLDTIFIKFYSHNNHRLCTFHFCLLPYTNYIRSYNDNKIYLNHELRFNNYNELNIFYKNYLLETCKSNILDVKEHFDINLFNFNHFDININFNCNKNKRKYF